ncbi:cytidylate kinase [Desulfofarcimen acetoxidans DSM 771]|uniref:Cytidylate kinase n=1 Tax=Desulfofarcimen acetoxidans (strain ATCC 49208 / DSM 771 / KCTC 5769 / VKM B-1644 / 5575) TaxID=485916 RepID=C8VZ19_DESAS|nr:(d)CMP kinase [Desulfofarcimen acetoxidans]ACV62929.1 cytidylate kinase [Desulfofarcimen acetoxidans DSM 771]
MIDNMSIAIDGPAGAGKSTVARLLAEKLGLLYIDTGAMYRTLTLSVLREQLDLSDEDRITKLAGALNIKLSNQPLDNKVFLNGEDVTEAIRQPEVSRNVALIARMPAVRQIMVNIQQSLAEKGKVVMEGRDIGNKVLPGATYKFFLTASPEERAKRRYRELIEKGYEVSLNDLVRDITERDNTDRTRLTDPLIPAPDAIIIDSTNMSLVEVTNNIIKLIAAGNNGGTSE